MLIIGHTKQEVGDRISTREKDTIKRLGEYELLEAGDYGTQHTVLQFTFGKKKHSWKQHTVKETVKGTA